MPRPPLGKEIGAPLLQSMAVWATKVALLFPYTYLHDARPESERRLAELRDSHLPPKGTYVWFGTRFGAHQGGGSFAYMEAYRVYGMQAPNSTEVDEVFTFSLGHAIFKVWKGPPLAEDPRIAPSAAIRPLVPIWPKPPTRKRAGQ